MWHGMVLSFGRCQHRCRFPRQAATAGVSAEGGGLCNRRACALRLLGDAEGGLHDRACRSRTETLLVWAGRLANDDEQTAVLVITDCLRG